MSDLISRKEALMALTGVNLPSDRDKLIALFDKRIKALPTVEPQGFENYLKQYLGENDLKIIGNDVWEETKAKAEQTEWRPCKNELPEKYGEYYVTWVTSAFDHPLVEIWEGEVTSEWDDERNNWKFEWLMDDYTKKNYPDAKVIAWMPLIEAYKEG